MSSTCPRCWAAEPDRLGKAGVADEVEFATKPALAAGMLARVQRAGIPARWVTADEVSGADPHPRAELEAQQVGYVLAIGCDRRIPTASGPVRADILASGLDQRAWQRLSAGDGAKGPAATSGPGSTTPTAPIVTTSSIPSAGRC